MLEESHYYINKAAKILELTEKVKNLPKIANPR